MILQRFRAKCMKILFCGGGALGSHALFLARDLQHELGGD